MKNNNLKFAILIFGLAITLFLFACGNKDGGVVYSDCHIKNFVCVGNYNSKNFDSVTNIIYTNPLNDSATVNYSKYSMLIGCPEIYDCSKPRSNRLKSINTVDQEEAYLVELLYDTLKELTLTSNEIYDATHPAGSSLNDLCLIQKAWLYPTSDEINSFSFPTEIDNFLSYKPVGYAQFFFTLTKPPTNESLHTLTVRYKDSYSEFEIIGKPIYIKP